MAIKYLFFVLILLSVHVTHEVSIILKTQDFNNLQFDPHVAGLPYPEYIRVDDLPTTLSMQIYNMTSETQTLRFNFTKAFNSTCQYGLENVDYGYFTKFPFYQVIADCANSTHTIVYNIKIYRSGDSQLLPGDIVPKSSDQLNCQQGPLKVQYFYSGIGQPSTFLYRVCVKNQTQTQSYYKQYTPDAKRPFMFKEDAIQKLTGLTNISLVDMQPALGVDGKYNAFLSQTNGLVINGGSKYIQTVWKIPGNEKPYKLQRLCWSNTLAILTEGYIYFVSVSFSLNQTITVTLIRKSDKINIDTTARCSFFTIGHTAICSLTNDTTTWYIYSEDKNLILTNQTERFSKIFKPYLSESVCSTNSFYQDKSRYQLYLPALKPQKAKSTRRSLIKKQLVGLYGQVVNFLDTQSLFVVSVNSTNYIYTVSYTKNNFDKFPIVIKTEPASKNISDIKIEYQIRKQFYNLPQVSTIYTDYIANKTNFQVYLCGNKTTGNFTASKSFTLQLPIENLAYLQNQGNTSEYFYVVKTPLEKNAYARFIFNGNTELRYPYEFQTNSFKVCSITSPNNQVLFYRQDQNALVVMRVGFRNKNFLALQDVRILTEYKWFNVECIHDGLFLYNAAQGKIIKLNSDLQAQSETIISFESLKFTKQYVLLKNGAFVEVRSLDQGDVIAVYKWSLDDIVTNLHSSGFINIKQSQYYEFASQESQETKSSLLTQ